MEPSVITDASAAPGAGEWSAGQRAFSVGTVMARTFEVWRRHPVQFLGAALLLEAPSLVVNHLQAAARPAAGPQKIALIVSALQTTLLTAALTFGTLESLAGRPVRLSAMFSTGLRKFGRVFEVAFRTGAMSALALLLLVVPGLMVMSALWLAVPAAVGEPDRDESPIARSRGLTKGHRWTIFLSLLLFLLLSLAAYAAVAYGYALIAGGITAGAVAVAISALALSAVAGGLYATAPAVAFHDLRALKEGGDSASLGKIFE